MAQKKADSHPCNYDIEKRVIASILFEPEYCKTALDSLSKKHFWNTFTKTILKISRELSSNGGEVDPLSIWDALNDDQRKIIGQQSALLALEVEPGISPNINSDIQILKEYAARREIWEQTEAINKAIARGEELSKIGSHAARITEAAGSVTTESKKGFVHIGELLKDATPIQWRIHGILEDKVFMNDFGDTGHYKTFVILDRMLCIAAGLDYHGHPVKQGTVFYICGEGQQGIIRRCMAWQAHKGINLNDIPFFVRKTVIDLMDAGSVDALRREIDAMIEGYGYPAMVYFDTLARNFGPGDENKTQDMNTAINHIDRYFGHDCIVGISQHTGLKDKDRARGSIALKAACDAQYQISFQETSGKVLVRGVKMKDATLPPPMQFSPQVIGLTIDGQPSESCVLILDAEGSDVQESQAQKLRGNHSRVMQILNDFYIECESNLVASGRAGTMPHVSINDLWERCKMAGLYQGKKCNFTRAVEKLKSQGVVCFDSSGVHLYPVEIFNRYNSDSFESESK